ncbi:hypothetical protein HZC27_05760 [Candidatus Roizmanbacteria bacterium]|nr:hypothetical protein [Candidatus Roizmanbacteria bacterium]
MSIFLIFLAWRLFDFFIAFLTPRFIPYLGFFPYGEIFKEYGLPSFISSFANFDGAQYLTLVREGYNTYTQAYFPLYFLLVKAVALLFPTPNAVRAHNDMLSAVLVSNVFFFFGLLLFKKYIAMLIGGANKWTIFFLLLFPTSFFFGAVYTEGLFFFLCIGSLYFLKKKNYWLAALFAALSSATRLMGIFLFIPFLFHFVDLKLIKNFKLKIKNLVILSPFIGFGIYCLYLWKTVGDPFFFFHVQPVFGANRSTNLILLPQVYFRYLKIFFTANWNFQYFVSLVEFFIFSFVFFIVILNLFQDLFKNKKMPKQVRHDRVGLGLFSLINILLPTLTGTFSSIPRYSLMSISFFLFLGELNNKYLKVFIALLFFILHVVLLGFFIQGYFVG